MCYFSVDDVKRILNSIPNNKAPGIDGFNNHFFKASLDVLKDDMHATIMDFFNTGKILKETNVTSITLIPKVSVTTYVSDFRAISCCNVLYNFISKLMCEKLGSVLSDVISHNQGACLW